MPRIFHRGIQTTEANFQTMDNAEIIKGYLAGEAEHFSLVDGWLRMALRSFFRRLGDGVEDVMGECHMELVARLRRGEFRAESGIKTYVWRMAQNRAIDQIRRLEAWDLMELDRVATELVSPWRGSAENTEDKDLAKRILEAMPEECRKLWMQVAWGFSYKEMSERSGVKVGTLRVRVRRCRERVDRYIEDQD